MRELDDYDYKADDRGWCEKHRARISLSDGCYQCDDERELEEEECAMTELENIRTALNGQRAINSALRKTNLDLHAQLMALRTDFQQFAAHDGACATLNGDNHCDCGLVDVLARYNG